MTLREAGTDAIRHCGSCNKDVYNLSAMTESEAEELLASAEEHCVRYYYRPDGTLVSSRCADAARRAPSPIAAGLAASLACSAAFAGITVAVDDPGAQVAIAGEPGVRVAMGGLRLRIKAQPESPVEAPVDNEPVADVPPSLAPACPDPWDDCATPAVRREAAIQVATVARSSAGVPVAATTGARDAGGRLALLGWLGGLVGMIAMLVAFRRRRWSTERLRALDEWSVPQVIAVAAGAAAVSTTAVAITVAAGTVAGGALVLAWFAQRSR